MDDRIIDAPVVRATNSKEAMSPVHRKYTRGNKHSHFSPPTALWSPYRTLSAWDSFVTITTSTSTSGKKDALEIILQIYHYKLKSNGGVSPSL